MRNLPVCVVLLSAAAAAQTGATLVRTNGVLGATLDYALRAKPDQLFALALSTNAGPTPLALIDPRDPRSLAVGLDLLPAWASGRLDATGRATVRYPLPTSATLQGTPIHAQLVTLPGAQTIVADISNATALRLAASGTLVNTVGDRGSAIDGHSATLLADGRVLLAGGLGLVTQNSGYPLALMQTFDPQTQTFATITGQLQAPRFSHSATLLADGRVLLAGGQDASGNATNTGEIYDPATGSTQPIPAMSTPRATHTATLLANGRVFVAGGLSLIDPSNPTATLASALDSTEVFDPANNTWKAGPKLPKKLTGHAASALRNGKALLTGGIEITVIFGLPFPTFTTACHLYDPATNALAAAAAMPSSRTYHAQITPATGNGSPLCVGGTRLSGLSYTMLAETLRYDPAANSWALLGSLQAARAYPSLVEAGSELIAIGGIASITSTGTAAEEPTVERSQVATVAWTGKVNMLLPRLSALAVPIDAGQRVLITGVGTTGGQTLDQTAEVYVR